MARVIVAGAEVGTVAARLPAGAARGTSREAIAGAVAFVVERYRPERVVLFGRGRRGRRGRRATSICWWCSICRRRRG